MFLIVKDSATGNTYYHKEEKSDVLDLKEGETFNIDNRLYKVVEREVEILKYQVVVTYLVYRS
jgi:hypothetical protein